MEVSTKGYAVQAFDSEHRSEAPPPVFVAVQQQVASNWRVRKTAVDVLIVDCAEKTGNN